MIVGKGEEGMMEDCCSPWWRIIDQGSEMGLPLMIALSAFIKRVACSLLHISLLDAAICVTSLVQGSSNGKRSLSTAKVTVEKY